MKKVDRPALAERNFNQEKFILFWYPTNNIQNILLVKRNKFVWFNAFYLTDFI